MNLSFLILKSFTFPLKVPQAKKYEFTNLKVDTSSTLNWLISSPDSVFIIVSSPSDLPIGGYK